MKPVVDLYKLGRLPYVKALNVQQVLFDKLKKKVAFNSHNDESNRPKSLVNFSKTSYLTNQPRERDEIVRNSLILVEHEPVYTIGIRSKQYNESYVSALKKELDKHNLEADFVFTNRGGLITFHGPGQLVAYPIIYLGDFSKTIQNKSVKAYVNVLETTIIDTLARIGLSGAHTVREYPGVWLDDGEKKIAFIGIACKRFVTMHGISINCDCNLSWFDHIVSCGIEDKTITSISQELLHQSTDQDLLIQDNGIDKVHLEQLADFSTSKTAAQFGRTIEDFSSFRNKCPRYDIEHVSEAFCLSFSQHFDCKLLENFQFKYINSEH